MFEKAQKSSQKHETVLPEAATMVGVFFLSDFGKCKITYKNEQ
jgi:hypothetical protein